MKKKIIIFASIALALVLILFVPYRRDSLNDGGTVVYDALAYKVVSWHRGLDDDAYKNTSVYWYPDNLRDEGELWQMELSCGLESTVSYVGYIEGYEIWLGALNKETFYESKVAHLPIFKFDTLTQFESFKSAIGDGHLNSTYNEMPSFNENTAKYDANFFEENSLMIVYVGANSGSYRYDVNSIYHNENVFCVHIEQTNAPEVVTDDMAGWFITVAVPDIFLTYCTEFDADLNNFTVPS